VSLSLLKVDMQGCVVLDVHLPCWTALGEVGSGSLNQVLLWCDGLSSAGGFSEVVP
jgi:hypothetical protein